MRTKIAKMVDYFEMLYCRWEDEKDYEDFTEYRKASKKRARELGYVLKSLTQRPFAMTFSSEAETVILRAEGGKLYQSIDR